MDSRKLINGSQKHTIQDVYYLEQIEQLEAIADPIRYRMYFMMTKPKTGAQLARALGISRARAHYHLKILREVGLVAFCGKGSSHGITEKYYQIVAYYLDFSKLIPKDQSSLIPNEVTLRSFKAAVEFVANMLDRSREGISHLKVHEGLGMGFHYTLNVQLTPDQFRSVRDELDTLKDRVIDMDFANERSDEALPLVNCRATLFLTPVSNEFVKTEPENAENDDGTNE